ncbi:MAG: hypothetical protein K9N35_11340 [Candidatus Marinimicrobia bacterium]|nr:hypothetical protein [Candidatus Neomarinimicrobiota bacterium]
MPELKYAKKRHLRRFEAVDQKQKRIEFRRLTSSYPKRSMLGLIIMAGIVGYLLYYLSKV